tara:strand:+ start:6937 stop:7380 length:444 start_codon:yes stop_codon:yes gene_type:complete
MTKPSADDTKYFGGHYNQSPGIASVGSYQVSGRPWVTGSVNLDHGTGDDISFPSVTKRVIVRNIGQGDLFLTFAPTSGPGGSLDAIQKNHYWTIEKVSGSIDLNVKCSRIVITNLSGVNDCRYQVAAELTGIAPGMMFPLTGSGITE